MNNKNYKNIIWLRPVLASLPEEKTKQFISLNEINQPLLNISMHLKRIVSRAQLRGSIIKY